MVFREKTINHKTTIIGGGGGGGGYTLPEESLGMCQGYCKKY